MFFAIAFLSYRHGLSTGNLRRGGRRINSRPYLVNARHNWRAEERYGRRGVPVLVLAREGALGEVTRDGGHGDIAGTPRLAPVKAERVVLDILVAGVVLQ